MKIDIAGRHFHVTEALKDYAAEKVAKLSKYSHNIDLVHIVMEVQKFHQIVEITARGKDIRFTAKEESEDMYAAFDNSLANIQLQLSRFHDKTKDHKARRYPKSARAKA